MKAYALYRNRSLLVFPSGEARDAYLARFFRYDDVRPITEEQAAAWKPASPHVKKVALWQDGQGRWCIKYVAVKPVEQSKGGT
jgi:hypothetical protein